MKTLITCHANADCDAFAAMLAARRLYDEAILLFPGTQEAALNKIQAGLDKDRYGFMDAREIPWDEIGRLVLVDTRQKERLGHVERILERPEVKIEVWDHHPDSPDDLPAQTEHISSAGSATSAICAELEKRGVRLDPEEATLLGLGIYGDTGSFSYASTSRDDYLAAAWLIGQGMDVARIGSMSCHELTSLHVQALNSLLESARTYEVGGVEVVLAEASLDNYLGDFAYLAQKLMEMEKCGALFAIGIMGDRIQIVGRSSADEINVGEVCASLGGGGHPYAASACVRGKMITEVRENILRQLYERTRPARSARDYMSAPPIGLEATATLHEADELMLHFGLKAAPVFTPGTRVCVGMLDAETAARGAAHGLGGEPVSEYMRRRIFTLPPEAGIRDLARIIVGERQRLVPIVVDGSVAGVVTRTDLINVFASEAGAFSPQGERAVKKREAPRQILEKTPAETLRILHLAGKLGQKLGLPVYAVGGFVRDLLLEHPNQDIDLVAEGNGIALARALARELGGRVREHEKFLTSVVIYHDGEGVERHIDVATARLEYYEYPAALPTVELSSIKMDLFRRDFSINSLALRLDGEPFGDLVDFFGGRRDIKDRVIRVLHTLSFVEDPTRCIRAVRFEQRYNFRIGPGTEKLIKNILPMRLLEKLSPQRVFNEFKHICMEERAAACIERLDGLGVLKALGPHLQLNPARREIVCAVERALAWHKLLFFEDEPQPWICYFLALSHKQNFASASENYDALGLPEAKKAAIMRQRGALRGLGRNLEDWQKKYDAGSAKISQFCDLLRGVSLECLLYQMAATGNPGLEKNISLYITQWRREKADINGDDLRRLGARPGPVYGRILKLALDAKLNGEAPNLKKQIALAARELKKDRETGAGALAQKAAEV